jgi:hypothetical protein
MLAAVEVRVARLVERECIACGHRVRRPARRFKGRAFVVCTPTSCAHWTRGEPHTDCFSEMRRRLQSGGKRDSPGYIDRQGYWRVRMPEHPRADKRGYVRKAWLVVEAELGRHLEPWEQVRFHDGDRSNLSPENLERFTVTALKERSERP